MAQQLRKYYAVFEQENTVLESGQIGVAFGYSSIGESQDVKMKMGDGVTGWNVLPFIVTRATPHLATTANLKVYTGNETRVFVESNGAYYDKVTAIGSLLNDDEVLVVSSYNGEYWLKDVGENPSITDFGAVADWREIAEEKTDTFSVTVPALDARVANVIDTSAYINVTTFGTGGQIGVNSRLEFKPTDTSADFKLEVEDYYVAGADDIYIIFKNMLEEAWTSASVDLTVTIYNPVVEVSSGVVTLPDGLIDSDDVGKLIQIEDSYLEKATAATSGFTNNRAANASRYSINTITGVSSASGTTTLTLSGETPDVDGTTLRAEVYTNSFDALQAMAYYADVKKRLNVTFPKGTVAIDPFDGDLYTFTSDDQSKGISLPFDGLNLTFSGVPGESYLKCVSNDRSFLTTDYDGSTSNEGNADERGFSFMFIGNGNNGVFDSDGVGFDAPVRGGKMGANGCQLVKFDSTDSRIKGRFAIRNSRNRENGVFRSLGSFDTTITDYNLNNLRSNVSRFDFIFENFVYKTWFNGLSAQVNDGIGVNWIVKGEYNVIDINARYGHPYSISLDGETYSTYEMTQNGKAAALLTVTSGSNLVTLNGGYLSWYDFFYNGASYSFGSSNHYYTTITVYDSDGTTELGTVTPSEVVIDGGIPKMQLDSNATFTTNGTTTGYFKVEYDTSHYIYGQGALNVDFKNLDMVGNGETFRFEGSTDRPNYALFRRFENVRMFGGTGFRVDNGGGYDAEGLFDVKDSIIVMNQSPEQGKFTNTDINGTVNGGTFIDCQFSLEPSIIKNATLKGCSGTVVLSGGSTVTYNIYSPERLGIRTTGAGNLNVEGGALEYLTLTTTPTSVNMNNVAFAGTDDTYNSFTVGLLPSTQKITGCSLGSIPFYAAGTNTPIELSRLPELDSISGVSTTLVTQSSIGTSSYRGRAWGTMPRVVELGSDGNVFTSDDWTNLTTAYGFLYELGSAMFASSDVRHGKTIQFTKPAGSTGPVEIRFYDVNTTAIVSRGYQTRAIDKDNGETITATYNKYFQSFLIHDRGDVGEATKPTRVGARDEYVPDTTIDNDAGWKYYCVPKKVTLLSQSISGLVSGNDVDLSTIIGSGATLADGFLDPKLSAPYPMKITLPISGGGTKEFEFDLDMPATIGAGVLFASDDSYIEIDPTDRYTIDTSNDGMTLDTTGSMDLEGVIYTVQAWKRYSPNGMEQVTTAQRTGMLSDCLEGYEVYDTDLSAKYIVTGGTWAAV